MCWGLSASLAMTGGGAIASYVAIRQRRAGVIPLTIGYFTAMEALQAAGYIVAGDCASPLNQIITFLSLLHIVFQPFFINAFAMEMSRTPIRPAARIIAYGACTFSAGFMLLQLYPFAWAGACQAGQTLCGETMCTSLGEWHLAWAAPFNGIIDLSDYAVGLPTAFPSYVLAAFVAPLFYGAWRFVIFHALVGPILASALTDNPNEMPAIWCFFSIGIVLTSLSPWLWRSLSPTRR
jgi:hypothetical protein